MDSMVLEIDTSRSRWFQVAILILGLVSPSLQIAAQDPAVVPVTGAPVENVTAGSDLGQRYAVYLPSSFDAQRKWPALLLMDPRGRAMVPLELFQRGAESFGYVILSSYGTLSDDATAFAQNDRALNAMMIDAQSRFSADAGRIYLVGFSGTAHYAWTIAAQLDGSLAGIIGVGGGLPAYSKPIQSGMAMKRPFSFYGIAGIGDFNYDGVRWLAEALDTTRVRNRFVTHPGMHAWPPEEIAFDAVVWMQLQAMRNELIETDNGFVRDLVETYLAEAEQMEESGDKASAYRRYHEIVADFDQFGLARDAKSRERALSADQDVLDELHRRDELARRVQLYKLSVREFRIAYQSTSPVIKHKDGLQALQVRDLLKQADNKDVQTAGAARRMLASAYANTSFYEPRIYIAEGDFERAAGMLRIADEIYSGVPRTCHKLAQVLAQLGEYDDAIQYLSCALDGGWTSPESVTQDSLLAPLRGTTAYAELMDIDRSE